MEGMPEDIHTNFAVEGPSAPNTTPPVEDDDDGPPPLWKQGLGAIAGSLIALALYTTYEAAAPVVTGWILPKEERHAVAEERHEEMPVKKVSTSARQKRANP